MLIYAIVQMVAIDHNDAGEHQKDSGVDDFVIELLGTDGKKEKSQHKKQSEQGVQRQVQPVGKTDARRGEDQHLQKYIGVVAVLNVKQAEPGRPEQQQNQIAQLEYGKGALSVPADIEEAGKQGRARRRGEIKAQICLRQVGNAEDWDTK